MEKVTVDQAKAMMRDDIKAMRREYTKMRDIAQKRIKRMGQTEFSETQTYKSNRLGFKRLRDLAPGDFAKAFSELSKFVTAKGSTIKGQQESKRKTTAKLNKAIGDEDEEGNPVTPVNSGNYWRVIKILNEARRQKISYGSDKMVELADATLGLSNEQFNDILDNLENALKESDTIGDSLEKYMKDKGLEGYQKVNMDDFITALGWDKPNLSTGR